MTNLSSIRFTLKKNATLSRFYRSEARRALHQSRKLRKKGLPVESMVWHSRVFQYRAMADQLRPETTALLAEMAVIKAQLKASDCRPPVRERAAVAVCA